MNKELLEFLELGTYEEKIKWLTREEKDLIAKERIPLWNKDVLDGYMTSNIIQHFFNKDFYDILWSGKEEFERRSKEWKLLNVIRLIELRAFNYYFLEGEEVMLDEYLFDNAQNKHYQHLIGKKAVVKKCTAEMHCIYGSSYVHELEFENGIKIPEGYDEETYVPLNFIPSYLIIRYKKQ